jgi:hypothetical protein
MPSDERRLYRSLLAACGASVGVLATSLGYEVFPQVMAFKDGVDPTLQGAAVGGALIGLLALTAALIEVEE